MANRVNDFLNLINERDTKIQEHCKKESWAELSNYPEERDWYTKNISPLDEKIVLLANSIIAKFSIPCKQAKTISDVYSNSWIMRLKQTKTSNVSTLVINYPNGEKNVSTIFWDKGPIVVEDESSITK
ncbi:MAG: hypothetical protein E7376_02130 [Clostridiales bacterium]|nr:hypothetical protein [Clostridiales bacterium]